MIRGKKNFLQPSRLEVGFGLLFCVGEQDIQYHVKERMVRGFNDNEMLDGVERKTKLPSAREEDPQEKLRRFERKLLRKQAAEEEENIAAAEAAYKESISNSAMLDNSELSNLDLRTAVEEVEDAPSAQSHEADNENMDFETDTKNSLVNEILNSKPKISRHQRKVMRGERLKKETSSDNKPQQDQMKAERESRSGSSKKMELVKSKTQKEKAKPMPRGKKGKLKKIKKSIRTKMRKRGAYV